MWRLRAPPEERRNSASVVELRRAQRLAEARRAEGDKSPSLRRANSCKEKDSDSDCYLKPPYPNHYGGKDSTSLLSKLSKKHSGSDSKINRKSSPRGSPKISPRGSPKSSRSSPKSSRNHESKLSSGIHFILGHHSKQPKDGRQVKDLRYCEPTYSDDAFSEGKRSRSNSTFSSLTDIPEISKVTAAESTKLVTESTRSSFSNYNSCDYFFKIMMIGDTGAGKTCFVTKFRDNIFLAGSFIATVGIDYRSKVVVVEDKRLQLQVWDTAGQERFRNLTRNYYRDVQGMILLYDIHHRGSFNNVRNWIADVRNLARPDVVILLIGNKCDLPESTRQVTREEGEELAREAGVAFMEASAKTGMNVELAFMAMAKQLKANFSSDPDERRFSVAQYVDSQQKRPFLSPCGECRLC